MVTGATRVAAVIGDPVRHSLSPAIHNAAFAAAGLDWVFVALEVAAGRGAAAVTAMEVLGLDGLSVTMPHKTDVAGAVDELSDAAAVLGSVNCVVRQDRRTVGHSTDGAGFLHGLRADLDLDPAGLDCVVVGAGGAARAVVAALAGAGAASVGVVNRSESAAHRAAALAGAVGSVVDGAAVDGAALVVNATPLGMGPDDPLPVDPDRLGGGQVVVDLIYHPAATDLLMAAAARGARTANGVGMLVGQAAEAFTLWTGEPAPLDAMRDAVRAAV